MAILMTSRDVRTWRKQRGFTVVELIAIIVIVGVLGAVATARYVDLRQNAADGVAKGVLGSLRAQNTFMFGQRMIRGTTAAYTMRQVALGLGEIKGIQWTASSTTFTMTVRGISYRFRLNPTPRAPTTYGRITAGTGTYATW